MHEPRKCRMQIKPEPECELDAEYEDAEYCSLEGYALRRRHSRRSGLLGVIPRNDKIFPKSLTSSHQLLSSLTH